ncbi:MAG: hypothetical protein SGI89_04870 [bacterium]|nr:hypothetical protein [bacterium]
MTISQIISFHPSLYFYRLIETSLNTNMKCIQNLIIFSLLLFALTSCSYAADRQKEISNYVSGKVIDEKNFPLPFVKVIIGSSEIQTDNNGKFKITDVKFPYDVVIVDRSTARAVIYKNLNEDSPDLIFFGKQSSRYSNSAVINVNFPEISQGSSAIIKFISSDVSYCRDIELSSGEKTKTLLVEWPLNKKNITGNIIFLQKNSTKFEQYSDKPITIFQSANPFKITFSGNMNYNTRSSDITIYLPFQDFKTKGYSVYADFLSYDRNSDILLAKQEGNIQKTKSIIPSILPISYRLKVSGFADYNDGSGFVNYTYTQPGATINLITENPPELKTPSDKFLGTTGNTEFSFTSGSGTGVYVVHYHSFYPEMEFYIVTAEKKSFLSYLSREEFKRASSIEFKWSVKKYLTYFSTDDFVKPKEFKNDVSYKAILYSSERTFKTGYF